ncbi:MAG: hypothetical protein LBD96_04585 [Treponema sp.]|nr:hypothetical protein [Treponema sp.]
MKKILIIMTAALALVLVPLSLGAQTTANAEFQYLSFDIGYAMGWNFNGTGSQATPSLFGFNIRVTDKLSAGIQTLTEGTATDNYLLLKYTFLPQVRATVGFGAQGTTPSTPVSSIGFEVIPFSRSVGGLAATEFKVAVKYDAPFSNLTSGKILFALAFGIGF